MNFRLAQKGVQSVLLRIWLADSSFTNAKGKRNRSLDTEQLTLRIGPSTIMLRELKLPMTSLGTPLPVSIVPKKFAELPILHPPG